MKKALEVGGILLMSAILAVGLLYFFKPEALKKFSKYVGAPNSQEMIVSTLIQPGQTPIAKVVWCAPASGGGHYNVPPISTTTDGVSANALVWFVNGTQLTAVDGDTGAKVVTTTGAACNRIPSMSFPIAVKNRIVVSALGHLCSWSPGGT